LKCIKVKLQQSLTQNVKLHFRTFLIFSFGEEILNKWCLLFSFMISICLELVTLSDNFLLIITFWFHQCIWFFRIQILCPIPITVIAFISNSGLPVTFEESALKLQCSKSDTSDYQNYISTDFVAESDMKLCHLSKWEYIKARKEWADKICTSLICTKISIIQGGSNMTGTDLCVNKCKQSRTYLNHLVVIFDETVTQDKLN